MAKKKEEAQPQEQPQEQPQPQAQPQEKMQQLYRPTLEMGNGTLITIGDLLLNLQGLVDEAVRLRIATLIDKRPDPSDVIDKVLEIRANIDATLKEMLPVVPVQEPDGEAASNE